MGNNGRLQFSDIEGKTRMLEVRCDRCGRYGRYNVARLIATYGREAPIPLFVATLNGDCPNLHHTDHFKRCAPHTPDMYRIVYGDHPRDSDESHTARLAWWGSR